jgi:hypothetical protein
MSVANKFARLPHFGFLFENTSRVSPRLRSTFGVQYNTGARELHLRAHDGRARILDLAFRSLDDSTTVVQQLS